MAHKKVNVSYDFVEMYFNDQVSFGENVYSLLFLLPVLFPHVTGGLAALDSANSDLKAKYKAYENNPTLLDDLKTSQRVWLAVMVAIAAYVQSIANGNSGIIDQSGFHKTKDSTTSAVQSATPIIVVGKSNITSGFDVELKAQKDANAFGGILYTGNLTPVFSGNQVSFTIVNCEEKYMVAFIASQQKKFSFRGLLSLVKMKFMCWAINSWGASHPTAPTDNGIL